MEKYEIKIAYDHTEADEFVSWMIEQGHTAEIGTDSGNYVDGVWTAIDENAYQIMKKLWTDYCKS